MNNKTMSSGQGGPSHLTSLPVEVLVAVLLHCDTHTALQCRAVSRHLCSVLSSSDYWHPATRSSLGLSAEQGRALWGATTNWDWRQYAVLCLKRPFGRNLLSNSSGQLLKEHKDKEFGASGRGGLKSIPHWIISSNGGDGWQVERPPIGADAVPNHQDIVGGGCFVTSYSECCKMQLVDLKQEIGGVELLDQVRPNIVVSDWCAGRHDCDSTYIIAVTLLGADRMKVMEWQKQLVVQGMQWQQVEHTFTAVPAGVRYVSFAHRGVDNRCWAGWYGAKMTGAAVRLSL